MFLGYFGEFGEAMEIIFVDVILSLLVPVTAFYLTSLQIKDDIPPRSLLLVWLFGFVLSLQFLKYLLMGYYSRLDGLILGGMVGVFVAIEFSTSKPKPPDRYTLALTKKINPTLSKLSKKLNLSEELIVLMVIAVLVLVLMGSLHYLAKT